MVKLFTGKTYICPIKTPKGKTCGKLKKLSERSKHQKAHRAARKASKKGESSEEKYAKRLRRKYKKSIVFQTGTESGVPDIILYHKKKISFYEVKPREGQGKNLKRDQYLWIKNNCFPKKFNAYLVTYYQTKGKIWIFDTIQLDKENIKKYR